MGDPKTALLEPYSLVITKELAGKLFPDSDPIGKRVHFNARGLSSLGGWMILSINSGFFYRLKYG